MNKETAFVVEDIDPSNARKGQYGQSFQIKTSKSRGASRNQAFFSGNTITYDEASGVKLCIQSVLDLGDVPEELNVNDYYTVTVQSDNPEDYLDNQFLDPGVIYFVVN